MEIEIEKKDFCLWLAAMVLSSLTLITSVDVIFLGLEKSQSFLIIIGFLFFITCILTLGFCLITFSSLVFPIVKEEIVKNADYWHKLIKKGIGQTIFSMHPAGDSFNAIRVEFEYIGEGLYGEYTGHDDDVPLFRFYIYFSNDGGYNFEEVNNGSYCTKLPIDTPVEKLKSLGQDIIEKVKIPLMNGESVKNICESFCYLDI